MENAELIAELRGHILSVPLTLLHAAADALEAAEKRIARLEEDLKTREAECEVMQDQYNALLEMMQEED